MNKSKDKSIKSIVLGDNQWFEKYLSICKNIYNTNSDENDLYLDILKDLYTDSIGDNIVVHLLSLLEQMAPFFDIDRVEQTVGSLLNIYTSSRKTDSIRRKYLITTTLIISCHSQMTQTNWPLNQLFESFIQLLIKNTEKGKSVIGLASSHCLREIANTSPDLLKDAYNKDQFKRQPSILSSLVANNMYRPQDIGVILSEMSNLSAVELYETLIKLYEAIRTNKSQELSPIIFKPYLAKLTLSSQVHNFHLALQLFLSFGLELFSTLQEQTLVKQLTVVATHPSLSIAHRLLALDYIKSVVVRLRSTAIDCSALQITAFDGPDTQEKKLSILNETEIDSHHLLVQLKPLRSLSLYHNLRAINAFYRIIFAILTKRPQILNEIQEILTFFIFKSPDPHIKRSINLFQVCKDLAKGTTHHLIKNLTNLSETETFKSLTEFNEFMIYFEWIFKQNDLDLNEKQLVFLLTIIGNNCKRWPESCGRALDCCTAVFYYQTITVSVKQVLLSMLGWLITNRKNDLSVTSLSQTYILALNTLEDDQNIKRVFNFEDQISLDTDIVEDLSSDVPLIVKRISQSFKQKHDLDETPYSLDLCFEITIAEEYKQKFDLMFGLILYFEAVDQNVCVECEIPVLESNERQTVDLQLRFPINKPFHLTISAIFNDSNGTNFRCDHIQTESITLRDFLIPIDLKNSNKSFEDLCKSVVKHKDGMQTVICLANLDSIEQFLSQCQWFTVFIISEDKRFVCGTPPDRLLLGVIEKVNNFVNLFLYTNNYRLLANIYYEFSSK